VTDADPYHLVLAGGAGRSLHRLPDKVAAAIIEFLTGPLAANPARLSKPLTNELSGYHAARRGDYRVIIRIDEDIHSVLVVRIDHRTDVYRTR
jgi:mRNA-degrading endonuclease RelE of RelBE toxin-antitoxin system